MGRKRPAKRAAAPKRAAKKAAVRPSSPLPPAESSDETRSRSRSEEDEEATNDSPVPASTPIPILKSTPAPSQKGGESESESSEEEEEEPVRPPPRNQPPPPQNKEDSDASDSEDEDEEEEEPALAAAPPPSALKKQPPQPQNKEDSDTSGDEEDEEEEAPPKPAPKVADASKPPAAAAETKKPGAVQCIWSIDDEVRILKTLAAHRKEHGTLPQQDALMGLFAGKLDNASYSSKELDSKVRSLRTRYLTLGKRVELPSKEHDRQLLDLAKKVWDSDNTTPVAAAAAVAANGHERKGFEEMCELYPYVAEEVKELEAARPGMCKREFGKMDDDKARAMDEKIKKQRAAQIRLQMRRSDLVKEVTKALLDLVN